MLKLSSKTNIDEHNHRISFTAQEKSEKKKKKRENENENGERETDYKESPLVPWEKGNSVFLDISILKLNNLLFQKWIPSSLLLQA